MVCTVSWEDKGSELSDFRGVRNSVWKREVGSIFWWRA